MNALQLDRLSMADLHALGCTLDRLQRVGEVLAETGEFTPEFCLVPGRSALMVPPVFAGGGLPWAAIVGEAYCALTDDLDDDLSEFPAAGQTGSPKAGVAENGGGGGVAAPVPAVDFEDDLLRAMTGDGLINQIPAGPSGPAAEKAPMPELAPGPVTAAATAEGPDGGRGHTSLLMPPDAPVTGGAATFAEVPPPERALRKSPPGEAAAEGRDNTLRLSAASVDADDIEDWERAELAPQLIEAFPEAAPVVGGEAALNPPAPGKAAGEGVDSALPPTAAPVSAKPALWLPAEDDRAIDAFRAALKRGETRDGAYLAVSKEVGRPILGVSYRFNHKLQARAAEVQLAVRREREAQKITARVAAKAPPAADPSDLAGHLRSLPDKGGSTPARDLELIDLACEGWDMGAIANDLGIDGKAVRERFDALTGVYKDGNDKTCRRFTREQVRDQLRRLVVLAE